MKIPPAATAVTVGITTSRNSRDRTRQFFSARREARPGAAAPGGRPPSWTGASPPGTEPSSATAPVAAGATPFVTWLNAGSWTPRIFLALDKAVPVPLTMTPTGVQRHRVPRRNRHEMLLPAGDSASTVLWDS